MSRDPIPSSQARLPTPDSRIPTPDSERDRRRRGGRARRLDARSISPRAFLDGGARFLQLRAKHLPGARVSRDRDGDRGAARGRSARSSSSTIAPTSRGCPAPTACMSARRISSPRAVRRRRRRRRRRRPVDAHRGAARRGARDEPVSYVAIGPVFGTTTKDDRLRCDRPGAWSVTRPARTTARGLPLVAIGGITLERAAVGRSPPAPRPWRSSATFWRPAIRRGQTREFLRVLNRIAAT